MSEPVPSQPARHSLIDDAQGLFTGGFMAAFGITILTQLGFVTGQTAGLAVLISYATGWQFGLVFFAVNLPFYWFRLQAARPGLHHQELHRRRTHCPF